MRIPALLLSLLVAVSLLVDGTASAMARARMQAEAAGIPAAGVSAAGSAECHAMPMAHGSKPHAGAADAKMPDPEPMPPHAPGGCGKHCTCACACPQVAALAAAWQPAPGARYSPPAPRRLATGHPQPALLHPIRPPIG